MKKSEFVSRLQQQTADVHVSEQLRMKTIEAIYAKEAQTMKRKFGRRLAAAALAIVMSILMCGAAVAAVKGMGILDFFSRTPNAYVPEDADGYIQKENILFDNELLTAEIQEIYYDGLQSQIIVHIESKDEKIMLLGGGVADDEIWANMNLFNESFDKSDRRTVWEVYQQGGYTAAYRIRIDVEGDDGPHSSNYEHTLNEDGTLSIVHLAEYSEDKTEREVKLTVNIIPMFKGEEQLHVTQDQAAALECPLMLNSAAAQKEIYVSSEKAQFPSVGVQVDQLRIEVKPLELYVSVYYSVTDEEAFDRMLYEDGEAIGEINLYTNFELIDPESTAVQPWDQRLSAGVTGQDSTAQLSADDELPQRFVEYFSIGKNELHDEYTLRVFEWASKERFESVTLKMRPASQEDLAEE